MGQTFESRIAALESVLADLSDQNPQAVFASMLQAEALEGELFAAYEKVYELRMEFSRAVAARFPEKMKNAALQASGSTEEDAALFYHPLDPSLVKCSPQSARFQVLKFLASADGPVRISEVQEHLREQEGIPRTDETRLRNLHFKAGNVMRDLHQLSLVNNLKRGLWEIAPHALAEDVRNTRVFSYHPPVTEAPPEPAPKKDGVKEKPVRAKGKSAKSKGRKTLQAPSRER